MSQVLEILLADQHFKTTKKFLDVLNLKNISMLPKLPEAIQEKDLYSEVV